MGDRDNDGAAVLINSLESLNRDVLQKIAGVGEYDLRRPMTPTGTNLLGVVKHLASVQAGYFGDVFGHPWPEAMPWIGPDSGTNDDMFCTPDQSTTWVRSFYERTWLHAKETFERVSLQDTGTVPWWPENRRHPTLQIVLVHMIAETARHAGHLDITRELIDDQIGRFDGDASIPGDAQFDWTAYVAKVEAAARAVPNS